VSFYFCTQYNVLPKNCWTQICKFNLIATKNSPYKFGEQTKNLGGRRGGGNGSKPLISDCPNIFRLIFFWLFPSDNSQNSPYQCVRVQRPYAAEYYRQTSVRWPLTPGVWADPRRELGHEVWPCAEVADLYYSIPNVKHVTINKTQLFPANIK